LRFQFFIFLSSLERLLPALFVPQPLRRQARLTTAWFSKFWLYAYRAIVIFLSGSVIIGTDLAVALLWE
jgi:hypothetical protein